MKVHVFMAGASLVVTSLALSAPLAAHAGPVVVNGDFEAVQIGSPFFSPNPADIPGWTHSGDAGDALLWNKGYCDSGGCIQATGDGDQFVTLGGGFLQLGSASWTTTVTGLTAGDHYNLNFKIAYEGADTFGLAQSITADFSSGATGGPQTFAATPNNTNYWAVWQSETMKFVATGPSAVVDFSVSNQINDIGLDAVSVSASVPEPAAWAMMLVGVGGLGATLRRRRRIACTAA